MKPSQLIDSFYIEKELDTALENVKNNLASGSCSSYDDYRYLVGVHDGISTLIGIVDDLKHKYLKDELEDAER